MPSTTTFPFAKKKIEALPVPSSGRAVYHDAATPALILRITPNGVKSFSFYRKYQGSPIKMHLGDFPETTIEAARNAAATYSGMVAQGIDPRTARRAARHEQTFKGLWAYWFADAQQRGVKTLTEDERRYKRFLAPWANRKLSAIHKTDVQALFAKVSIDNGRYAANRLLALVKSMFHKAPDMGFAGADPTAGVKKHKEEKRDRYIRGAELQSFFKALIAEPNETLRDLLLVALLTGARKGNVMAMRWDEIDFTTNLWRITMTKSGKPVVVPLVPPAVAILDMRHKANGSSPWVFPSNRGKTGHITEVKSAWKRIVTAAKLTDCRPHDLRRSLASYMAIAGISLPTIGAMLGHSQPSTTAIYARLSNDPVRTAAQTATGNILEFGGVKLLDGNLVIDVASENAAESPAV